MNNEELQARALEKQRDNRNAVIRQRAIPEIFLYCLLFIAIIIATPIHRRYPIEITLTGIAIFSINFVRLLWILAHARISARNKQLWRWGFYFGFILGSAVWGIFCCMTVTSFELSWTSFFALLLTSGLGAGIVPALAPFEVLLKIDLALLLGPSLIANFFLAGGLQGYALGTFFFAFLLLLFFQATIQSKQYWKSEHDHSKIRAMVDAVPGTMAWISSDLRYIGVNKLLADLWQVDPDDFVGQRIGFKDPQSNLVTFSQKIFEGSSSSYARELERNIAGQPRTYLMVGSRYNHDTEAVILGIDVSNYKKVESELLLRRAQSFYTARLTVLGELVGDVYLELNAPKQAIESSLNRLIDASTLDRLTQEMMLTEVSQIQEAVSEIQLLGSALSRFASGHQDEVTATVSLNTLLREAFVLCKERFREGNINLSLENKVSEVSLTCKPNQIFQVLVSLMNNARDAVLKYDDKWVRVTAVLKPAIDSTNSSREVHISVTDSGHGIPEEVRTRIFEPLFSTKEGGTRSGVGLSVSREIAEDHGGSLSLNTDSPNTEFVIALPISSTPS